MSGPGSFRTSRQLAHPAATVFEAFADPATLASWWGPNGFRNEFEEFDFRPGGTWRFVMIGPDGRRYPNESTFSEIEPARSIVVRHRSAPVFTLRIELTAEPGGTRVNWTQTFDDPSVAAAIRPVVEPANEQNLDRLTAALRGAGSAA